MSSVVSVGVEDGRTGARHRQRRCTRKSNIRLAIWRYSTKVGAARRDGTRRHCLWMPDLAGVWSGGMPFQASTCASRFPTRSMAAMAHGTSFLEPHLYLQSITAARAVEAGLLRPAIAPRGGAGDSRKPAALDAPALLLCFQGSKEPLKPRWGEDCGFLLWL